MSSGNWVLRREGTASTSNAVIPLGLSTAPYIDNRYILDVTVNMSDRIFIITRDDKISPIPERDSPVLHGTKIPTSLCTANQGEINTKT